MKNKPSLIHLQLTRNCNLKCYFCGQWGKKGFFSDASGSEMTINDWKGVLLDIKTSYSPLPKIMLWGGEPLVCPFFEEIVEFLKANDFTLGMITNGVLLDRHMDLCKKSFEKIYVSIDGTESIHDSIRGKGVYKKVIANLTELTKSKVTTVITTVLSPLLIEHLDEFVKEISFTFASELLLQNYIRLSPDEAKKYHKWAKNNFNIEAKEIDSWVTKLPDDYEEKKNVVIKRVLEKNSNIKITYIPHTPSGICQSPNKHIHISWNGDVLFCTDFYDFSAGNVRTEKITDIFNSGRADQFRKCLSENPCCSHCSWKTNKEYNL